MINDNNNNPSVVRPQSYISLRARWEILFSLGYLPLSIYLYISFQQQQQDIKNGVQIQNTPNGQSKATKMGWRAETKKRGSKWISLSLSSPIVEMKPRDFLYIYIT